MLRRLMLALVAVAACSRDPSPTPVWTADLLEAPDLEIGKVVVIDLVEPLHGDGVVRVVDLPEGDVGGNSLALEARGIDAGALVGPMRVRGALDYRFPKESLLDSRSSTRDRALVLNVTSAEPLPPARPLVAPPAHEIERDRRRWDRQVVVYEGEWSTGFEQSSLDHVIWVGVRRLAIEGPYIRQTGRPIEADRYRVRVTGRLYAHTGARYGHLGGYTMALEATRLEILEVLRREP